MPEKVRGKLTVRADPTATLLRRDLPSSDYGMAGKVQLSIKATYTERE
jgi:hypothetical protein